TTPLNEAPSDQAAKIRLTVQLSFQNKNYGDHVIGRFRISVASEVPRFQNIEWVDAVSTPRARVAAAHLSQNEPRRARDYLLKTSHITPDATVSDWLVLALAHLRLNELDSARKACGKAADQLRPADATGDLRRLVQAVVKELAKDDAVAKELIAAAAE